jgi:hypothetical protein
MKSFIFWDMVLCSSLQGNLPGYFVLVSCLAYSLALKMEVTCSSEMAVDFQRATWHYIPEELFIP